MAHVSIQRSKDLPSCSRCNGPLILAAQMPQLDASGNRSAWSCAEPAMPGTPRLALWSASRLTDSNSNQR